MPESFQLNHLAGDGSRHRVNISAVQEKRVMATDFSVQGEDGHKKALLQAAIRKFGLKIEENFDPSLIEALKQGKGFDGCIVGEAGESVLTLGEEKETHFVLPGD